MYVFLSYDAADRATAARLAARLRRSGYNVYPNSDWPSNVTLAIRKADALVVLISPAAMDSPWVPQELNLAITSPKLAGRLIPVVVKPTPTMPWVLKSLAPVTLKSDVAKTARKIGTRLARIKAGPASP